MVLHGLLANVTRYSLCQLPTSCVFFANKDKDKNKNRKRAGVRENTSPILLKVFERSVRVETVLFCALVGTANFFLRLFTSNPVCALNALAGLEVLVDLEEVLDFKTVEL